MDANWKLGGGGIGWRQRSGLRGHGGGLDGGVGLSSMLPPPAAMLDCGYLQLDRIARRAVLAGVELSLTHREYDVLLCLADRANRVVRRGDLLERVWTVEDDHGSNLVAVYIGRLRQKLGVYASMIVTIRGIGYRLRHAPDSEAVA